MYMSHSSIVGSLSSPFTASCPAMPPVPQTPRASRPTCENIGKSDTWPKESLADSRGHGRDVWIKYGRTGPTMAAKHTIRLTQTIQPPMISEEEGSEQLPEKPPIGPNSRKVLSRRTGEIGARDNVPVSLRSPTPSEFGDEFHDPEMTGVRVLTPEIYRYLDDRHLEAFAVPNDGNCLFRALTFGPQVSKHDLARKGDAGYLAALKQNSNPLDGLSAAELDEIRTDRMWENAGIGEHQVKAAAEYLGVNIEIIDASNLNRPLRIFPPTPIVDDERQNGPPAPESQRVVPEEPIRLLLYSEHYYPVLPKNSFPGAPRDSTRVVRLQSPFSESLDDSVTPPEPGIAKLKGSDLGHLTPKEVSMGKAEPELLAPSRPIEPLLTEDRTQVSNEIKEPGKVAEVSEARVALTAEETRVKDQGLSFSTLGDVALGLFAGVGVATTIYAVVKGGQALWRFLNGRNRMKGRSRKRRMINFVHEE